MKELVDTVADVAGKQITPHWVEGVVGVHSRNFSNDRIEALGWSPSYTLRDGMAETYPWIAEQVTASAR